MKQNSRDVFAFSLRGLSTMAPAGIALVVDDSKLRKPRCHSDVEETRCAATARFECASETAQLVG